MILATRHRLDKEGTLPGTHRLAGCVLARGASSHLGSLLTCESNTTSPRKNTAMPAPKSSPCPLPAPQLSTDHPNVPPRCSFAGLQVAEHTALTDCTEPAMKHPTLNLPYATPVPSISSSLPVQLLSSVSALEDRFSFSSACSRDLDTLIGSGCLGSSELGNSSSKG